MNIEEVIQLCLSYPETEETTPFGPDTLVYKVCGKLFALTAPDQYPSRVNLKCDPDEALELRDQYEAIIPGYHMNKKHWNSVYMNGVTKKQLMQLAFSIPLSIFQLIIISSPTYW